MFVTRKHRNKHISCNPPLSIHYLKSCTKSLSALGWGLEWRNDSITELTLLSKIQIGHFVNLILLCSDLKNSIVYHNTSVDIFPLFIGPESCTVLLLMLRIMLATAFWLAFWLGSWRLVIKLNFCSDFEHKGWSRFRSWSLGKISKMEFVQHFAADVL